MMRTRRPKTFQISVIIISILCLVYFLAPSQDYRVNKQDTNYESVESIYKTTVSIVDKFTDINFQYENKTFYDHLQSVNYFKDLKTDKQFEKGLCQLPFLDIWETKIKKLLKKPNAFKCRKDTPLSYIKENILYIDELINKQKYQDGIKTCKFAPVIRSAIQVDTFILGEFKAFTSGLPMIDDCVKVKCFNGKDVLKYEYVHYNIRRLKGKIPDEESGKKMNVLIIIFDSVSASSFIRSLPKTLNFLKRFTNFFQFAKHHTVGQNTLPNLVPMFAGKDSDQLLGKALRPPPFDEFPFIWKNFSRSNYVTYLNEDWKNSMFNNDKFGFRESPTDYYLKPFWLSAYKSMPSAPNKQNSNLDPCYYDKLYHQLSFDWLRQFQHVYNATSQQNTFGIVKSNEMSHDYLERLFLIDDDLHDLLKDLFTGAFLKNTLLVLMGDHGHRSHPIRHTYTGKIEEKMPFFSMMVPEKLLEKNPFLSDVLKQNTQTLTTFYDVYETLSQLLIDQDSIEPSQSLYLQDKLTRSSPGYSLFLPVPYRNCAQALIPEYLCTCNANSKLALSAKELVSVNEAAKYLVKYINEVLLVDHQDICMPLEFKQIKDAQIVDPRLFKYSIIFETEPNSAIFDGLVVADSKAKEGFSVIGKISRVNLYGSTSNCMESYFLKNYCYCRSYHNGSIIS